MVNKHKSNIARAASLLGQRSARKLTREERRLRAQRAVIERWNRAGRAKVEAAQIEVMREELKRYARRRCEVLQRRMDLREKER